MNFTHQNHLKNISIPDVRPGVIAKSYVIMGECSRRPKSPMEEAENAASLIYRRAGTTPIDLFLSGGVDSECMALAFLRSGIPFNVNILRFNDDLNKHDICYAEDFCRKWKIDPHFIDFDVIDFFARGEHLRYARAYDCNSPQLAVHLKMLDLTSGYPVLAWNVLNVRCDTSGRIQLGLPSYKYFSYCRFLKAVAREGSPFFFLYTPELAYSFLRLPRIQKLIETQQEGSSANVPIEMSYHEKCKTYREGGFASADREKKFTGFERLKVHYAHVLQERETIFDTLYRRPLEAMVGKVNNEFAVFSKRWLTEELR